MLVRAFFVAVLLFPQWVTVAAAEDASGRAPVEVIDLPTTLRLAGAQNLDVEIARQRLAEARANYESALWQFFPWLSPGIGYRRHDDLIQDVGGSIIDVHKESYSVGPSLYGQLDLGEAIYKRLSTRQLLKASDIAVESQREQMLLEAAQRYFDLARAQLSVNVARQALAISTNYSAQVSQAVEAGIAFRGDLLRVQVQVNRNLLLLRQAQEQQRVAAARLSEVLHLDASLNLTAADEEFAPLSLVDPAVSLEKLVSDALAARPELKQARSLVEAAGANRRGAVYGPAIPTLGVQIFAGGLGGGKEHTPSEFGASEDYQVTLGWRIGPGGLFDRSRIRASEARLSQAQLQAAKLLDEVRRQIVESFARRQSTRDQVTTSERNVQTAAESLRLMEERKLFAVGAVLETIDAEQELARARLDLLSAIAENNKAEYALARSTGAPLLSAVTNQVPSAPPPSGKR